jgi:GT2 family glycosyltransferase
MGLELCSTPLILICNDDVVLDENCVAELVRCMAENPSAAMTCPLITLFSNPETVNTVGNRLAITGFYSARGKGRSAAEFRDASELASVSGCCFLYRRDIYNEVGGFSNDFDNFGPAWHASYEDVDLSCRVRAAGYKILYRPTAILQHRYVQKAMNPERFASMVFGRAMLVLRNFEIRTMVRLTPLFAISDMALLCYACVKGPRFLNELLRTWIWIPAHAVAILKMRQRIQSKRRVRDKAMLPLLDEMVEVTPAADRHCLVQWGAQVIQWMSHMYRQFAFSGTPFSTETTTHLG